ncbi:tyrosine-type recombinase/integrase [Mycobacterium sp. ENV421]|uniref:tyrosine-type recombinase/integrase n=1 Tax=Mycobacterium sp. ENV421 TaxID=1213407 RepID=UPI0013049A11|nr:tyrosine-type recombinase/integrase [Mycobacterium sp. ENV421]
MLELSMLVGDYMTFRAARGFQPNRKVEHLLIQFAASVAAERDDGLLFSQGDALAWAHAPVGAQPSWLSDRLSVVRGFAYYLAGSGLPVGVPAVRLGASGSRRATPYLYSVNDIRVLVATAHELFTPLRAATMTTLIGLLAVTGMRIGETVRLAVSDLDLDQGIIVIAHAKLGRQRMVRLDQTSCDALGGYLSSRARRRFDTGAESALFVTQKGTALTVHTAEGAFHQLVQHAGLPARPGARPRLHDFRHTFATQTMIDAYRCDRDPARTLTLLSVWLGHSNPADTYWYLQAAPEIAEVAVRRLGSGTTS